MEENGLANRITSGHEPTTMCTNNTLSATDAIPADTKHDSHVINIVFYYPLNLNFLIIC